MILLFSTHKMARTLFVSREIMPILEKYAMPF
jgi:hypothetical protein